MDFYSVLLCLLTLSATFTIGNMSNSITMNTHEGKPIGSKIGTLTPPSTSSASPRPIYMMASDDDALFRVDNDGGVYVAKMIDLETLCDEIQACCSHSQPCESTSTVMVDDGLGGVGSIKLRVRIRDENDHAPRFRQADGQTVSISEKVPVGSTINIESAIDLDWSQENQISGYMLHGDKLKEKFEVEKPEFQNVRLKLKEPLNYEKERVYHGNLEACDRQNCTSAPLTVNVIDANDNLPFFQLPLEHVLDIPENFPVNGIIIKLNATDLDSPANAQMHFEMVPTEDANVPVTFRLDETNGEVTLSRKLHAHVRDTYTFKVRVRESSLNSEFQHSTFSDSQSDTVKVTIHVKDINDFAPEITFIDPPEGTSIQIPENSPAGRILVMRVRDRDVGENGRVECNLDERATAQPSFKLNRSTDLIHMVYSLRSFDAEVEPLLMVNITCWDAGMPRQSKQRQILIHIKDINEHIPFFSKQEYTAQIAENSPADEQVIQVLATDNDHSAYLQYSLKGDGERFFKIDVNNGAITTIGGGPQGSSRLDREMTPEVTFYVLVQDAKPSGEGEPHNEVFTAQAMVTVKVLDVNDNPPSFTATGPFYLLENHPKYTQVNGHLNAVDPDEGLNGKVKYALQDIWATDSGIQKHDLFRIDETLGNLQALEELDREKCSDYTLRVVACDMALMDQRCSRINVTIAILDVNDNGPDWLFPMGGGNGQEESVNVTSDAVPGQVIAQLVAQDRDAGQNGRVRYALHDPHSQVAFSVNATTGQITVADRYSYLTEAAGVTPTQAKLTTPPALYPGVYKLKIRASDLGHPPLYSDTWLTIRVVGVNTGIFGIQTGLLILLVLVTLIIAICLVAAIVCIRHNSKQLNSCKPCCLTKDRRHPDSNVVHNGSHVGYILPQEHSGYIDYPTFMKQAGRNYIIHKPGSVCSGEPDGGGGGVCPITDLGVTEFYAPYSQQKSMEVFMPPEGALLNPEQMRFVEVPESSSRSGSYLSFIKPDGKQFQSLRRESPTRQHGGSMQMVGYPMYNTCETAANLQFRQASGSPEYRYCSRGAGDEIFELPSETARYSSGRLPTLPTSEQFEGGSADSGRGVSEDEPQQQPQQHHYHHHHQPNFSQFGGSNEGSGTGFTLPYTTQNFQTSTFCPVTAPMSSGHATKQMSFRPQTTVCEEFTANSDDCLGV